MRRLFCIAALICSLSAEAAVTAEVDKNPVLIGEVLQLRVSSDQSKDEPELGALNQDFQILSRSSSSQFQLINGKASRNYEWHFQLRPLRVGLLRIPPIQIDGESSQAIEVRVEKPNTQAGEWPEAFIEFDAEQSEAWLREQVILEFRLYVRGDLSAGNITPPSSDQAVIEALGEQQQSQEIKGQHRYRVIRQRYALFAEQSGTIQVNGPVFNGEISMPGQRPSIFGLSRARRPIYAAGEGLSLNILAPPDNLAGAQWLPASDVSLSEELQPDTQALQAGEPLTRVIRLQVKGQLHTQLPALDIPSPANAQAYTEPPQDSTRSDGRQMIALREYSSAVIAGNGSELILPGVSIEWWNTQTNQLETATLPARTLRIEALTMPSPSPAPEAQTPSPQAKEGVMQAASADSGISASARRWQIIAIACAAGWLGTVLAWLWSSRRKTSSPPNPGQQRRIGNQDALIKTLRVAPAAEAREALLQWARERVGRYQSLGSLAKRLNDPASKAALMSLDAAAFGRSDEFDREALIRCLDQLKPQPKPTTALPPLYPES